MNTAARLDDATNIAATAAALTGIARLKIVGEFNNLRKALQAGALAGIARLKTVGRLNELRRLLTGQGAKPAPQPEPAPLAQPDAAEAIAAGRAERRSTSGFYDFDPNRKQSQRKRDNAAAMELLRQIDAGTLQAAALTPQQKAALAKYSGTGGALVGADGKKGSAYEYYTPKPIAEGMWALLGELGFAGGKVLDPSAGTGVFGATAPVHAAIDAVELNETSGRVQQLVNDGPGYKTTISPFEAVAAATPDEVYDAVITNVPFGDLKDRGANRFKDSRYQDEPLQNYFVLRALEKLRPGGLAAFITPPRCVSGKGGKEEGLRVAASYMAEFLGAYRLPNKVFGTAAADTMTDVIVFRKYSREALDKIAELREANPGLLAEINVQWQEFVSGDYFKGEGKPFVIGDFAKAKGRFGETTVLNSELSVADIAKLMRKFGPSRVDWARLDAAETLPIVYNEGDTIRQAGQTLQMQNGRWVELNEEPNAAAQASEELLARLSTAITAVTAGATLEQAQQVHDWLIDSGRALDVPAWLRSTLKALQQVDSGRRASAWNACVTGQAVDEAMTAHQGEEEGFNYLEAYPVLAEAMQRYASDCKAIPAALPRHLKAAAAKVGIHWSRKDGFSAVWRGDVAKTGEDTRSEAERFEAAKYAAGGVYVDIEQARAVFGEAFNPLEDPAWCVSPDGKSVCKADDYYIGNYAEFLERVDGEIAQATDDAVRAKLLRQKLDAQQRVERVDPSGMSFNLFSPFVKLEEKAEFVRRFVDPRFVVAYDEKTGKPYIECDIGTPKNERERNLKRFAEYVNSGTVSTRTAAKDKESNPELEKARLAALREMVRTTNEQFGAWVKANPVVMGRLNETANDPARLYFKQVDDESALTIPGLNPDWKLHGYQNAFVRRTAREFSGINGFGVGLGKTATALASVQYAQSVGTKRKTMFVVPNSVLSNWRKEAARVYASTDECLFVGLTEDGKGGFKVSSSDYDRDLNRILENRHSKIFVTMEALQRLRLRDETARAYDKHLADVDASYAASDDKKKDERSAGLREALIQQLTNDKSKSAAAPYFEDLGVDSLVMDEAHAYKNSRATVEFKGGKFLSLADPSGRGLDAQAKAWYVRKNNARGDGVLLLTATPVTNSPLEVYSMLSLSVGDQKLNDMMMGVRGSDDFMELMCQMDDRDEETLDGTVKPYRVFTGLNNVQVLRQALGTTCTLKSAADVGAQIVVPQADEQPVGVALPESVTATLQEYKQAFRFAIDTLMEKKEIGGSKAAYDRVAEKFGEPMELIGHPFNLINKMSMLIADPELDQRGTFYTIPKAQAELAGRVIEQFNALKVIEDRARPGPLTAEDAVIGQKTVRDGDNEVKLDRIHVRASLAGERVVIDTIDNAAQSRFEALADKAGLDLDVTVPPKLAALLENFQREEANPRGVVNGAKTPRVRQLIFCDVLSLHNKIKRLLTKRCGVAASAIAIITGRINGKPEEILEVQDGFNAEGEGNKYRVIIANEKAEVGINLQIGTQAIHHVSLGWTPDSLTQRNGRGVRQGNQTERVTVYHYDADGTFDAYKRMLVGTKASWIDSLISPDGGDSVAVAGGLTREQLEALIDSVGDADAMGRIQAKAEAAERAARAATTQGKQVVNVQTALKQQDFLKKYAAPLDWVKDKLAAYVTLREQADQLEARLGSGKLSAAFEIKMRDRLAELQARRDGLRRQLDEAVTITNKRYQIGERVNLDEFIRGAGRYMKRGDKLGELAANKLGDSYNYDIQVNEASAIANEWQAEVDMAAGMVEEAKREFQRLAGHEGGYPAEMVSRIEAGEAQVIDGKIVCAGSFVRRGAALGVVYAGGRGLAVRFLEGTRGWAEALADAMRGATVALPGAPGYDACITEAAQAEDAMFADPARALPSDSTDALLSSHVPEVAQRRTTPTLVRYSVYGHSLPQPYFPVVLMQDKAEMPGVAVVKLIVEQQRAVVRSTQPSQWGSSTFVVDSSVAVASDRTEALPAAVEFARAHRVKLTLADIDALGYSGISSQMFNTGATDFQEAVIAGADSEQVLAERLRKWLTDEALVAVDLSGNEQLQSSPLSLLRALSYGKAMQYENAQRQLRAASEPAPTPTPTPAPATDTDPMRLIGITGDTRTWKEEIKSASRQVGKEPDWDGSASPLRWNVPYAAWEKLIASYPRAAQALQVIDASRQTRGSTGSSYNRYGRYGRR